MLLVSLALIPVATAAGVEPWAVTIGLLVHLRRLVPALPDVELLGGAFRVRGSIVLPRAGSTLRRRLRGPHAPGPRAGRAVLAPPRRPVTAARGAAPGCPRDVCQAATAGRPTSRDQTDREPKTPRWMTPPFARSSGSTCARAPALRRARRPTSPEQHGHLHHLPGPARPGRSRCWRTWRADEIDAAVAWAPRETRARSTGSIPGCCGAGGTRQGSFALAPQEGGCTSQRVGLPESTSQATSSLYDGGSHG